MEATETKYTPGAIRAAAIFVEDRIHRHIPLNVYAYAEIIDRETNAKELLEASKEALHELSCFLGCCGEDEIQDSFQGFMSAANKLEAAIAKATPDK